MHIFITGGTSRLGSALVRSLTKKGHIVTFSFHSSEALARDLSTETGATAVALDLSKLTGQGATDLFGQFEAAPFDAVINNSSVFEYDRPGEIAADLLDKCYLVNLRAPLLLLDEFSKLSPDSPRIAINVLDSKIKSPNPDYASYTIMKQALCGATSLYALQLRDKNIKVYGVAPAMFAESGPLTKGKVAELSSINPLGHELTERDVVQTIEFLLSGTAQSGEVVVVDAGQTLMRLPRDVAYLDKASNTKGHNED